MVYERYSEPGDDRTVTIREWHDQNGRKTVELRLVAEPDDDHIRVERASGKRVSQGIRVEREDVDAVIDGLETLRERLEDDTDAA